MLPTSVICSRCRKRGFLTLRWVRSSLYCTVEPPNPVSHWIDLPLLNAIPGSAQRESTTKRKRNLLRYAPTWHLYIGHYDSDKYQRAMERYKNGRLKSRPNGRIWHKVRYKQVKGQLQSDLEILMMKYNFNQMDIINKRKEKEENMRLKRGLL